MVLDAASKPARGDSSERDGADAGLFEPPLSITRPEFLEGGSDRDFRKLIWSLLVVAARLQKYPEAFGRHIGISSAMYTVLIATAHVQGRSGVGIRRLAEYMRLPAPHITTTVGKLVGAGLLAKRRNPDDARGVLVSLTDAGAAALVRLSSFQRPVNDVLFDNLSRADFAALRRLIGIMVSNSERALEKVAELERAAGEESGRTNRGAGAARD